MTEVEIVKMSSKGQLVVPHEVRTAANLNPGEKFVAFPVNEGVFFKKIRMPEINMDFENLAKEIEKSFKKSKVKKSDVDGAVVWARKK